MFPVRLVPVAFLSGSLLAGCSGDVHGPGENGGVEEGAPPLNPTTGLPAAEPNAGLDPVTGQPVIDPVTGLPVLDPVTGLPVGDVTNGTPVIDPVTGQPVVDPLTGSPVTEPADPGGEDNDMGVSEMPVNSRDALAQACAAKGGALSIGVTKLRRLSVLQFDNMVHSLLGGDFGSFAEQLPADEPMGPFVSNQSLSVGALEARQYSAAAKAVAEKAVASGATFLPCSLPTNDDTACIDQFIRELAPRAFRRPLEADEAEQLLDVYVFGRDGVNGEPHNPSNGLELLLRAIIGSPNTLYIVDTPVSGEASTTPQAASAYTLASRLALGFWNAPPDAELSALATSGELLDPSIFASQVQRVINDPKARDTLAQLFAELTGVDELLIKEKDTSLFPEFDGALAREMLEEQAAFVTDVIFEGDGRFSTLLTTTHSSPGESLAELYGATLVGNEAVYPPGERLGLFTQAAYLTAHNKADETSPVHLGINVREAILCQTMPPPPPEVDTTLPEAGGTVLTSRDRFELHEANPLCASCHVLIDPIGLAFEQYDAVGRYRETDNGAPIDPTGQIINLNGTAGPMFTGALELSQQLAESKDVQDCIARQVLRSVLDRQESSNDACTVLDAIDKFDATSGNIKALIADIAETEAFKNVLLDPSGDL